MIDPLVSLSFLMHSNPGVYAVLLGSGVSRSAHIPTGWEIILDLCRKLATLAGENADEDPAGWYVSRFGHEPDYSKLLHEIAKTPMERQQVLRRYFEPSEDERELGHKLPTAAHRAIARLMGKGYVRVAITTNFDRLLEQAVGDEGIAPTVISTADAIAGAMPLAHQKSLIIKLHGDFLDSRIRNTVAELEAYDGQTRALLDRVLDEFGLIVCGWSAQWDAALRDAIAGGPSRRFGLFWASRGPPKHDAAVLIAQRQGTPISIESAEKFFPRLAETVFAIEDSQRPDPRSIQAAVALTKRFLSEPRHEIALHDLLLEQTERTADDLHRLGAGHLQDNAREFDFRKAWAGYCDSIQLLQATLVHCFAWAGEHQLPMLIQCIERIADVCPEIAQRQLARGLWHYPSVVLLYSAGVAALSKDRNTAVARLLHRASRSAGGESGTVVHTTEWVALHNIAKKVYPNAAYVPFSAHLFETLRSILRPIIPRDAAYESAFDRFEYVRSLVYMDLENPDDGDGWAPPGRFSYKRGRASVADPIQAEVEGAKRSWPLLSAGLFEGSLDRFRSAQKRVAAQTQKLGFH